ncbi:MAG TPA: hypothetical protein VEU96_33105 [Bryobacteraceae bacterium]|nr:hypothetical protein [Bryobacteraceae bacterium]
MRSTSTAFYLLGLLLACGTLCAQFPQVYFRGVVNAASYMSPGLPGGAIARGSVFSVFGSNLGPASSPSLAFPLQTTLGNISITVTSGATVVNAIPIYVSPTQINAIMPSNAPLGLASLTVRTSNTHSNPAPVRITDSSFGIFTASGGGSGPGILQNYISADTQPINSLQQAAMPGQVLTLWGTGLGAVTFPDNVAPTPGNLPVQTEVFVGGKSARLLYNGRSPCCSGVDQIVLQIPGDAPNGCWVPVYVRTKGANVSNFVTIAISPDGSPCTEPSNALPTALINGGNIGMVMAARVAVHHDVGVDSTNDGVTDLLGAYFAQEKTGPFNFNPMFSLPPAGTCTSYTFAGEFPNGAGGFLPGMTPPTGRALNAGPITLSSGGAPPSNQTATSLAPGMFLTFLGGSISTIPGVLNTSFLAPGNFTTSGAAGNDAGSFQANFAMAAPPGWTNRDQLSVITRNKGFTATWTGIANGNTVFVSGGGVDLPANSTGLFLCIAKPGDTSLTVPPDVLANVPPTHTRLIQSRSAVYVGQWPIANPVSFNASGLDFGWLLGVGVSGKTVMFQ